MLIGLVIYLSGSRFLPTDARRVAGEPVAKARLTASEKRRILGLLMLWPMGVAFWTAQSQILNVYNVWLRDHVEMHVGGFAVPVPWMQSLDGLAPAL